MSSERALDWVEGVRPNGSVVGWEDVIELAKAALLRLVECLLCPQDTASAEVASPLAT